MTLAPAGRALLVAALPVWENEHAAIESLLAEAGPDRLRGDLRALSDRRNTCRLLPLRAIGTR